MGVSTHPLDIPTPGEGMSTGLTCRKEYYGILGGMLVVVEPIFK